MDACTGHEDGERATLRHGKREAPLRTRFSPPVLILAVLLLAFIVPPAVFLLNASLFRTRPDGSFDQLTLKFYAQLFASPFFLESLWNTFVYAVGSAVVAVALGMIQALIVERTDAPGRGYVFLGAIVSLGVPQCSIRSAGSCCSARRVPSTISCAPHPAASPRR